ncbi:DUF4198 domain-containing protein [Rhodobacterales bacterium HKCCE3408]|nr:DUF4198 domain-containing protein [Rhodobacterales bacterium HKCCE3408]
MRSHLRVAATLAAILVAGKGLAHEFWIEPLQFTVEPGTQFQADLRNGVEFEGSTFSYLPRNFTRFEIYSGGEAMPVEGRLGDSPALSVDGLPDGLAVIVHETTDNRLNWDEWERFAAFAEHKDFGDPVALMEDRGLEPAPPIVELYSRHVKSLVGVGDAAGEDSHIGLRTEFVALANPYTDDVSGGMPVQLWDRDALRTNVQVELFDRGPDGEVEITYHRTDDEGIAVLPVTPGHVYMVDAVILEPLEPTDSSPAVWHTLWANLTFSVPE